MSELEISDMLIDDIEWFFSVPWFKFLLKLQTNDLPARVS